MTTEAHNIKFRGQMEKLETSKRTPDKVKMLPRERIRIKRRCKLCGRARAVYRKFGVYRICFRDLASGGLIPGVTRPNLHYFTVESTDVGVAEFSCTESTAPLFRAVIVTESPGKHAEKYRALANRTFARRCSRAGWALEVLRSAPRMIDQKPYPHLNRVTC